MSSFRQITASTLDEIDLSTPTSARLVRLNFLAHMITRLEEGFGSLLKSTGDTTLSPVLTQLESWLVRFSHLHRQSLLVLLPPRGFDLNERISYNECRETVFPRPLDPTPRIQTAIIHTSSTPSLRVAGTGYEYSSNSPPRDYMGTSSRHLRRDGSHRVCPVR